MRNRLWNGRSAFLIIPLLILMGACAKSVGPGEFSSIGPSNTNDSNATPKQLDPNAVEPETTDNSGEIQNSDEVDTIVKNILGKWISACQAVSVNSVSNSASDDSSERYIVDLYEKTFVLNILHFSGSKSCDPRSYKSTESLPFSMTVESGVMERNQAFALDIVDSSVKMGSPRNVLLILANNENARGGRIIFELFGAEHSGMRLNVEEWKDFLDGALECHDATLKILKERRDILHDKKRNTNRSVLYTNSNTFTRVSEADDEFVNLIGK